MPTTKKTETTQKQTQTQNTSQSGESTNTQSWQNNYDPASMAAYHAILPAWQSQVQSLISNPFSNPWLNIAQGMQQQQIGNQLATSKSQLINNLRQGGLGVGSPFGLSQLNKIGRASSSANALANNNLLLKSWDSGMDALRMAQAYSPLVTGGSQTQTQKYSQTGNAQMTGQSNSSTVEKTGGVGTWLGPAVGIGLGLATGGLGFPSAGGLMGATSPSKVAQVANTPSLMGGGLNNGMNLPQFTGFNTPLGYDPLAGYSNSKAVTNPFLRT